MGRLYKEASSFTNTWIDYSTNIYSKKNTSIIIPVYHPEHIDDVMKHLERIEGIQEILLVDDSGKQDCSFQLSKKYNVDLKIIKHKQNLGRPAARNTGAAYAKGDILIFLDQDMLLAPDFVNSAKSILETNKGKGIVLGMRKTVPYSVIEHLNTWDFPAKENDWRRQTPVLDTFIDLTATGVGSAYNNCKPGQILDIYEKTDGFRKLGVAPCLTIGFWDLPSMVISHSMAISRREFFEIGGFPEWIQGWGGEDIAIGFLAIANHNPIILSEAVSYHIEHSPHSGSDNKKNLELSQNILNYRKWVKELDAFPILIEKDLKSRALLDSKV